MDSNNNIFFIKAQLAVVGLLFCFHFQMKAQSTDDQIWSVSRTSKVFIKGKTNVNEFTCSVNEITTVDTISSFTKSNGKVCVFYPNEIKIAVNNFDCSNKMMEQDLQATLKSDEFPFIKISFITLTKDDETNETMANLWIEIAGQKRLQNAICSLSESSNNKTLVGSKNICLSDFKVEAPQKFMGMVKVQDQIEVNFEILFEVISGD